MSGSCFAIFCLFVCFFGGGFFGTVKSYFAFLIYPWGNNLSQPLNPWSLAHWKKNCSSLVVFFLFFVFCFDCYLGRGWGGGVKAMNPPYYRIFRSRNQRSPWTKWLTQGLTSPPWVARLEEDPSGRASPAAGCR